MVEMVGERVVDDPDQGAEFVGECEGDADVGVGVDEVGGSVDGVDYECGSEGECAAGCCFFAEEARGC